MAYTTFDAVEADFKDMEFTSTSLVKDVDVTQFIVEADALINSYLSSRYEVPVTGVQSLALMSLYSRTLVSERIRGILANKQATNTDANQNVKQGGLSVVQVLEALKNLKDGDTTLVDATLLITNGGFFSNNASNDIAPVFKKDERQW